jgi:hypothetical protein
LVTLVMRGKPLSTRPVRTDSAHGDLGAVGLADGKSAPGGSSVLEPVSIRSE